MVSWLTRLEDPGALHPRNSSPVTPPDSRVCVSFFPAQLVIRPVMRVARLVYGDTVVAGGVSAPRPSELFRPGGEVSSTTGQDEDTQHEENKRGHREINLQILRFFVK